ncbi:hypothetical protein PLANPX_3299 [Lacipirellula parvula]|uniref:Uncharacterized protein n=1 Tax=Lacipirellula parvula TaxID=2650471 RepID=A0A5K7XCE5_9BACT|nr:hypothetical protein PLANPX_3299 [Lacipirellula parvula]
MRSRSARRNVYFDERTKKPCVFDLKSRNAGFSEATLTGLEPAFIGLLSNCERSL